MLLQGGCLSISTDVFERVKVYGLILLEEGTSYALPDRTYKVRRVLMRKMKTKRIWSFILAIMLLLSVCNTTFSVHADENSLQMATLTVNYYLKDGNGNMIHEPYIAQQLVGSSYHVESPVIDGFQLCDDTQAAITGTLTEDKTVEVYYTYEQATFPYKITYKGYNPATNETITLDTVTGSAPAGTTIAVEYKEFYGYEKENIDDMSLVVTADGNAEKTLKYIFKEDPYIIFRTQGTYVAPIQAKIGVDISAQIQSIANPTRQGYTFSGWEYNGTTYESADALSQALTKMPSELTYVNAVWEPAEVNYTVLVWFENANDDGYTLHSNDKTRQAVTGTTVTANPEDKKKGDGQLDDKGEEFYGFDYSHCDDVTVNSDGKSVLNLYYDREIWTIELLENDGELWETFSGKYGSDLPGNFPNSTALGLHYQQYNGQEFAYMIDAEEQEETMVVSPTGFNLKENLKLSPLYNSEVGVYYLFTYNQSVDGESYEELRDELMATKRGDKLEWVGLEYQEGFDWTDGSVYTSQEELSDDVVTQKHDIRNENVPDININWVNQNWNKLWKVNDDGIMYCYLGKSIYSKNTGGFKKYNYFYRDRVKNDVTYVSQGETVFTQYDIYYEASIQLPGAPGNVPEHMKFGGWYTSPELMDITEPLTKYKMPADDLTLYAKWEPIDYTVTFNSQGGTTVDPQSVSYNTPASEPEIPVREGYTFTGWFTQPEGGEIWVFDKSIIEDMTLYAHWRKNVTAPFTINHIIEGESDPFYTKTGESTIGDTIYAAALSPTDEAYPDNVYLKPEAASQTIVLSENGENTVTFVYSRMGQKSYTVSYLKEGTDQKLLEDKQVPTTNTIVTEFPAQIENYQCTNKNGYETKTLTEDSENHIIFYYKSGDEAVKENITIYPEDITIYTGGTDGEGTSNDFPHPIYLMKDSEGNPSVAGMLTFQVNGSGYYTAEDLFEVKYFDENGIEITSDETYGDFKARIVLKLPDSTEQKITTTGGNTVAFEDGTLRIRYVSSFTEASDNLLTSQGIKYSDESDKAEKMKEVENKGQAGVLLPDDTVIYLNGKPQYEYPQSATEHIALFFDELLPDKAGSDNSTYTNMLIEHAGDEGFYVDKENSQFRYLDLVDTADSNAWVSSSEGSDVFWPYPEGTDKSTEFQLLHFTGLHREYRMNGVSLADQVKASEVEKITSFTKTDAGIWFHIEESGFSPFSLSWSRKVYQLLPETGGIGTTRIYIAGTVLGLFIAGLEGRYIGRRLRKMNRHKKH